MVRKPKLMPYMQTLTPLSIVAISESSSNLTSCSYLIAPSSSNNSLAYIGLQLRNTFCVKY